MLNENDEQQAQAKGNNVPAEGDKNALLSGTVRYRLTFGYGMLEFSAPYAKDRKELGKLLEGVGKGLQDEGKKIVGECPVCMTFILDDEAHVCAR